MDRLNSLMTNTTSLVGYIALLIIAGASLGGNADLQASTLKGSLIEASFRAKEPTARKAFVTIEGKVYEAWINSEDSQDAHFAY